MYVLVIITDIHAGLWTYLDYCTVEKFRYVSYFGTELISIRTVRLLRVENGEKFLIFNSLKNIFLHSNMQSNNI